MSAIWQFYEQGPKDTIHNPIAGEFFSTEAVGNVAGALVREAIQNTLDARRTRSDGRREPARCRIYLSEIFGALPPNRARRWFGSLWPHVIAPANGLRNQPADGDPCPFLVVEDFGTTGLTGDPGDHQVREKVPNNFLNFFRAEGQSDKGGQDRGSWGVGKTVFSRASRISSFIGLTVRYGDMKELLLGKSTLKYHSVRGKPYKSDGYFGVPREDGFMLPTDEPSILQDFRGDFCIRRQREPGLSVVVPWYETDEEGITHGRVTEAVLAGFFYPILMGHLSVAIATPDSEVVFDANSIAREVKSIHEKWAEALLPLLELAEWAQTRTDKEFLSLKGPDPGSAQKWSDDMVPGEVAANVREALSRRMPVAIRVPMSIQPRENGIQATLFNVFLESCDSEGERPVFIRQELIISDVKAPRVPQVRSLVIAEHGPLANLLRDAETPAHTQWNQDSGHFKNKYKFGPGAIKFVCLSVSELLRIINQAEQKPDPTLTLDFFSLPAPDDGEEGIPGRRHKRRDRSGTEPPSEPRPPVSAPRRFRIDRLIGGFAIRPGDASTATPRQILIRVAYDVRRGNPLRKYNRADFDLSVPPIRIDGESAGVRVREVQGNRMLVAIESHDFNLEVAGFDPDRDLYVKAEVREADDGD